MKKVSWTILLLIVTIQLMAQKMERKNDKWIPVAPDTIWVNNGTSYLIFNHDIYSYGIGNDEDFMGVVYNNCLQIRSANQRSTPSSIFVNYGDSSYRQYYYAVLKFDPNQTKEYYDYRNEFYRRKESAVQEGEEKFKVKENQENMFITELQTRANVLKTMPDEIFNIGVKETNVSASLRAIYTDKQYAYFKILVENETAVDYELDMISFQYMSKYKMGFLRARKIKLTDVFPVVKNDKKVIGSYSKEYLTYVVPVYGIKSNEKMLITMREKYGNRVIPLILDNRVITRAKQLENRN